jgi:nitrous oxide reductase
MWNVPSAQNDREAVKKGDFKEMNGVAVIDGRKGSPYTRYVPVSNNPHGINSAPDGIHVTTQRPGAGAPIAWTSNETVISPAFSNLSDTGTRSPCFNGVASPISIR